jgi:serine/threonine protein phosphatase PrpC
MPYALVANCGDSRLITDDGTGGSNYRQVTTDHRPADPDESERLRKAKDITEISVKEDPTEEPHPILRLFPGGLAVSRTIGDVNLTKAAIPTPDIFRVPLHVTKEEIATKRETHQRFILGTDGLFDVLSNEEIGRLAARVQETKDGQKRILSTGDATEAVMNHCLTYADHFDDIHLLVVDVNYFAADETISHHEVE